METSFLKRYQDFCKTRELKDEIFKMTAKDNETLEEFVEKVSTHGLTKRSPKSYLN